MKIFRSENSLSRQHYRFHWSDNSPINRCADFKSESGIVSKYSYTIYGDARSDTYRIHATSAAREWRAWHIILSGVRSIMMAMLRHCGISPIMHFLFFFFFSFFLPLYLVNCYCSTVSALTYVPRLCSWWYIPDCPTIFFCLSFSNRFHWRSYFRYFLTFTTCTILLTCIGLMTRPYHVE